MYDKKTYMAAYGRRYRASNPEREVAKSARDYANNKRARLAVKKQYRIDNPHRMAFLYQRKSAKRRGVVFQITFEEWRDWWGDRFQYRGKGPDDLNMCRYADEGSYRLGNIYVASGSENKAGPRPLPEPGF